MSKAKTETKMDSFQSWAHRWGRVGTLIALIYMVALPFVVLAAYDSIPSLGEVFNVNTFSILLIYIPVGFSEALSYTPILGCSAYLAFITGNIMNLKLPVAANAMNLTKKQPNTPEGEAIASVAVAVSSLMTVAILTLAAVCASFIKSGIRAARRQDGLRLPAAGPVRLHGAGPVRQLVQWQQGGQGWHQGGASGADHHDGALPRRTPCGLRFRAGRTCGHLYHRDAAHRHPDFLCAVEEGQDPGSGQRAEVKQSERSGSCMVQGSGRFAFIKGAGVTTPHLPKIDK